MNSTRALRGAAEFPALPGRLGEAPPTYPPRVSSSQASPVRIGPVEGDRPQIREQAHRVVVTLLIDCSGSEYGSNGDPTGIRMACGRSLLRLMKATGGGRIAVVHWGTRPTLTLGSTSVTTGYRTIDETLRQDPGNMGANDFPAALGVAARILDDEADDVIPLVIGITDGVESVTTTMTAAVNALPAGSVHMLFVPGDACPPDFVQEWLTLPLGSLTRLPVENALLAHTVGAIYATAVGGRLAAGNRRIPNPFRHRA